MRKVYYPQKKKPDPLLKIGLKRETLAYTDKNIDPNLNFLNRFLYDEERKKLDKLERQKQEFKYISKAYEESHYQNPNLTKKKINVDHISGKIGQENREIQFNNYQNSGSKLTTDQAFSKPFKPDIKSINYHGYNIINNNILGFCNPNQQFPSSSYQNTYLGKQLPDESAGFTPEEYQEYLRLKNKLVMNKEKEMKGSLVNMKVPGRGDIINETRRISTEENNRRIREYNRNVQNLMKEQRVLDKGQVDYFLNKDYGESKRQHEIYMNELQKRKDLENDNNINNSKINIEEEQFLREREEYEKKYKQQMINNSELNNNIQLNNKIGAEEIPYYQQMQEQQNIQSERAIPNEKIPTFINENQPNNPPNNMNQNPNINKDIEYEQYILSQLNQNEKKEKMENSEIKESNNNNPKRTDKDYLAYMELMREKEEKEKENIINRPEGNNEIINKEIPQINNKLSQEEIERMEYENYLMEKEREMMMLQQREEVDPEYLKKLQSYEAIVQDQPINLKENENLINKSRNYENPYTTNKNYNIGKSTLDQNPISQSNNSYKFDFNKYYLVNGNRINSGRLKNAGNRIIGK